MISTDDLPQVAPEYDLRDLLEAGCHFGHNASDWHPKMDPWIYAQQDGIHIFDLEKTAQQLQKAYNYFYSLGKQGKTIIFLGTKRQAKETVEEKAREAGVLWITSRWLGGLLTNWEQVSKSLRKMIEIEEGLESGKYDMYTKYEQTQLEKDANRLARFFDGLRGLKKLPDAIFVIDPRKEQIAVKEAAIVDVPVTAVVDTNADPSDIDLVIPANDDGRGSIELIVTQLTEAYRRGVEERTGKVSTTAKKTDSKKTDSKKTEFKKVVAEEPEKEQTAPTVEIESKSVKKSVEKPAEKPKQEKKPQSAELPEPSMSLTRDELNELAEQYGIENPDSMPRKQAVVDAINKQR